MRLCSLEINEELVQALSTKEAPWIKGWPENWLGWISQLEKVEDGLWSASLECESHNGKVEWLVQIGDASTLSLFGYNFDYVWQDAFSPKKNPELWSGDWFREVLTHSKDEVILVTYSVARVVKDGLLDGGWHFEKCKGSGMKKQWMRATKQRT